MTIDGIQYGKYFAEMLTANVDSLLISGFKRDRNPRAPFVFGEAHLRRHVRTAYTPPADWPHLAMERRVHDGKVDYCFISKDGDNEVLATCEVKGPTRPILLRDSNRNFYPPIVKDIKRQVERATEVPDAQHYLGLLIICPPNLDARSALGRVFQEMLREVPQAKVNECAWIESNGLHIVVNRVLRATTLASPSGTPT